MPSQGQDGRAEDLEAAESIEEGNSPRRQATMALCLVKATPVVIRHLPGVLNADFRTWCHSNHILCRSMSQLTIDEARSLAEGELNFNLQARFGPAVVHNSVALAFLTAWVNLPGEQFAASCAALAVELGASYERLQPRLDRQPNRNLYDLLAVVSFGPNPALGEHLFDRQQRRRIWGALTEQLTQLERDQDGSSLAWFEFLALSFVQSVSVNFLSDWCTEEMRGAPDGGPGEDRSKALLAAMVKSAELDRHAQQGTQPPSRIKLHPRFPCDCCKHSPGADSGNGGGSGSGNGGASSSNTGTATASSSANASASGASGLAGQQAPQQLSPQQLSPQQLSPQQLSPQQLSPQQLSPQQLSPQQLSPQQLSPQQQQQQPQGLQQGKPQVPDGDPSGWRVAQLRAFLTSRGIDSRHCLEKVHLVELCRDSLASEPAGSRPGDQAAEPSAAAPEGSRKEAVDVDNVTSSSGSAGGAGFSPKQCAECRATESREGGKLLRCSGCKVVRYCSAECQHKAWKQHKVTCRRQ